MPEKTQEKTPARDRETLPAPDVVNDLEFNCYEIAQNYINSLDDPGEIKDNNGLFVGMLKEIYNKYLVYVLANNNGVNNRYDFNILDRIFNIYTSLVYKYKQNKRATILEFSIFANVSRDTLYNAALGNTKKLSHIETNMVKKWFTECENTLTNNSSVFDMFLLKSHPVYRYNDNLAPVPISDQGSILALNELPDLGPNDKTAGQLPDKTGSK